MTKRFLVGICIVFLSTVAFGQYVVELTIPQYGQDNSIYGGPACAQMIMNGYPPPGTPMYYPQSEIWASIQAHNSGEPGWATDPMGMQGALLELNDPPVGTWMIMSYDVREDLMFQILYWMNQNSYAVPTLINSGFHWVVVVGYETDIEPEWNTTPVLQEITYHDPMPIGVGQVITMTGTVWYDTKWDNPISIAGTWYNKYVAVIEPPEIQGSIIIDHIDRRGITPISPEEAIQYAEAWITQLNLAAKDTSYALLSDQNKEPQGAILVREEIDFSKADVERVPYYYIIPFAINETNADNFTDQRTVDNPGAQVCVVVNAFTGAYEEVASFGEPIQYLGEDEAVKAALASVKMDNEGVEVTATLIYTPCNLTYSRTYPFWKIEIKDMVLYVDQESKVYTKEDIIPQHHGD